MPSTGLIVVLLTFCSLLNLCASFRLQSTAVTGRIHCGPGKPVKGILVKLVDEDDGPDPDDLLEQGYTDAQGRFSLKGDTRELTNIDPFVKLYHNCNNAGYPCPRKWRIGVPDKYISSGRTPKKTFDLGDVNLEVELDGETHDCIH